jgi:hypothetical protein
VTTSVSLHDLVRDLKDERDELRAENARLREALAAAPRWVSVTERLPDRGQHYLVKFQVRGNIVQAYAALNTVHFLKDNHIDTSAWQTIDGWVISGTVTHWLDTAPGAEGTR